MQYPTSRISPLPRAFKCQSAEASSPPGSGTGPVLGNGRAPVGSDRLQGNGQALSIALTGSAQRRRCPGTGTGTSPEQYRRYKLERRVQACTSGIAPVLIATPKPPAGVLDCAGWGQLMDSGRTASASPGGGVRPRAYTPGKNWKRAPPPSLSRPKAPDHTRCRWSCSYQSTSDTSARP
jgi:hypothetical protein